MTNIRMEPDHEEELTAKLQQVVDQFLLEHPEYREGVALSHDTAKVIKCFGDERVTKALMDWAEN